MSISEGHVIAGERLSINLLIVNQLVGGLGHQGRGVAQCSQWDLWNTRDQTISFMYHPTASWDRFNLNTSDSEIMQSDWSVV